jgi:hypothetical protein
VRGAARVVLADHGGGARGRRGADPLAGAARQAGRAYVAQVERFAHRQGIPLVRFEKRASKEELARP